MSELKQIRINNSKRHAVLNGKQKVPGAKLYDQLLNAFYCDGDIPADSKELEKSIKEGKYLQWDAFLKEAYLVAPVKDIKNSPYGVTPYSRSGCKYPHHVIRNNELVLSIPALKAAYSRAKQMGIFYGEVKEHLKRHYKELDIYEDSTMALEEKIEKNFSDIEQFIYEQTGIDLHCPTTIYEEDIDNGVIRPLMRDDVTNPYFVNWLFRSYEFCDDNPEKFDYNMLVNNDAMGNYVYGYFVNDKLEGIIKVKYRTPEDYYAISMLFVNDQNESKGIGQALMKYVINKYGDKEMRLNVFEFNRRAMHIYKKYGFDVAASDVAKPEADGDTNKLVGQKFYKMIRKPTEYDPPLSFDKLPDHLKSDPVHAWRAKTGIELIHKEPSLEELNRIWDNWNKMSDEQKAISDKKSIEFFGKNNHDHYIELVREYSKTIDQAAMNISPSGYFSEDDVSNGLQTNKRYTIDAEDIFDEASHGKLKYDFRMGWDYNTGHKIKVVYSLDNVNVTGVGDFYLQAYGYNKGETLDSYLDYTRKNINKKGSVDHQSKGQKVLAIVDMVTNKKLNKVKMVNPFCPGINTRETSQSNINNIRAEAAKNPSNYINELEVGKVDNKSTFKTTHWPTKSVIDPKTGEDLQFRRIAKEEIYKHGRGKKIDKLMTKDFRIYGSDTNYNIYDTPNKQQALQELYMRERDIVNYVKELDKHKDEFSDYQSHRANEINNLRIIQRDINTIKNGKYELSIMKKYRESDEGRLAGLSGKQLLEYHTYMDFRPSEESIYDIDINDEDNTTSYTISESVDENKESDRKNNFVPIFGIVKSYSSDSVRNDGTIKSAGELASVKFDKIIHMLTRGDNYSHALVSFDDSLTNMYSYEDEGFVVDNIMEKESWMGTKSIYICVMFVNKEDRDRMKKYVKDLKKNQHQSRYASSNLLKAYVGTPKKVDKRFVCSSFTGYIMSCSNPKNLHRDFSRLRPEDITILPRAFYVMNVKDREDFKAKQSEIKSKVRSIYKEYHDEIDDYNNHLPKILLKDRCDELKTIDKIFDWIIDRM